MLRKLCQLRSCHYDFAASSEEILSATVASVSINVERKKNELEGVCRMRSL